MENNKMTFAEYVVLAGEVYRDNPDWRMGQAFYNTLHHHRPGLAGLCNDSEFDPFYNDKVAPFLMWLAERW